MPKELEELRKAIKGFTRVIDAAADVGKEERIQPAPNRQTQTVEPNRPAPTPPKKSPSTGDESVSL